MFTRTLVSTVTFAHPFVIEGHDGVHPPGTYSVEIDEELLPSVSMQAYRRVSTLMRFPAGDGASGSSQIVAVGSHDLADALARDAALGATPAPSAPPARPRPSSPTWPRWCAVAAAVTLAAALLLF